MANVFDLKRALWLLYSDINTRLNILIEECAYLQSTAYGMLPDDVVTFLKETRERDGQRKWSHDAGRSAEIRSTAKYTSLSPDEKIYFHLIDLLGMLLEGLEENKRTLVASFFEAFDDKKKTNANYAKFVALRGYLLNDVILLYTRDLEHVHEKIVQMVENHAGSLPQPIYFRRWNSAINEGFFSTYTRHINWEIAIYLARLERGGRPLSEGERDRVAESFTVTHTWSHSPTSHVDRRRTDSGATFGMVRSAYFYLEQPVLLPLLYHEIAHLHIEASIREKGKHEHFDGTENQLFLLKDELRDALSAACQFEGDAFSKNVNLWEILTDEIWSDVLAVALCGKPYLMALSLQLFGQSGADFYSQRKNGDEIAYEEMGKDATFRLDTAPLARDPTYFWEARLLVAARAFAELYPPEKHGSFAAQVEDGVRAWWTGGDAILGARPLFSTEAHKRWAQRKAVNEWLASAASRYLKPIYGQLGTNRHVSNWQSLPDRMSDNLNWTLQAYCKKYFSKCQGAADVRPRPIERIEACAVEARLMVSYGAVKMLESFTDEGERLNRLNAYSNYVRHDGGMAFRLGLEALLARDSLYAEIAAIFEHSLSPSSFDPVQYIYDPLESLLKRAGLDPLSIRPACFADMTNAERRDFSVWLRKRKNFDHDPGSNKKFAFLGEELKKHYVDPILLRIVTLLFSGGPSSELNVGTLSLGHFRSQSFARPRGVENEAPYISAVRKLRAWTKGNYDWIQETLSRSGVDKYGQEAAVRELVGDYSFLTYFHHVTTAERDSCIADPPKVLVKPRVVVKIDPAGDIGFLEPQPGEIGRLTLVKFPYRWHWLAARVTLSKLEENDALYLSSAWEDAIIVSIRKSFKDLVVLHEKLGLAAQCPSGVDSQSVLMVPESGSAPPSEVKWNWQEPPYFGSALKPISYGAFGRHDYVLLFNDDAKAVQSYYNRITTLPLEFWGQVANYSSIVEWNLQQSNGIEGVPVAEAQNGQQVTGQGTEVEPFLLCRIHLTPIA